MKPVSQRTASATVVLLVAVSALLSACASTPDAQALPAPGAAATSGTDAAVSLTGSRIPARRSEKMVSQVGGKDYQETAAAQPAPLRSN
jgi:uncharacterized lipoprotein YajG